MSNSRPGITLFLKISALTVAMPWGLLGAAVLLKAVGLGLLIGTLIFIPLSLYFLPVAIIFGEPHFTVEIGAGPNDIIGATIVVLFYSVVSLTLTLIIGRRRGESHER